MSEVCKEKNIDYLAVSNDLKKIDSENIQSSHKFDEWKLDFLVDYILNTHHEYVKKSIPVLLEYTNKVSKVHGKEHPEVITIANLFIEIAEELNGHMAKEEQILFPYIKQLVTSKSKEDLVGHCAFGSVKNPINMMEHEHELVGDLFKTISTLSNNYTPPEDGCATYKVSFLKL